MRNATVIGILPVLLLGALPLRGETVPRGDIALLRMAERFEAQAYEVLDEAIREHQYFPRGRDEGLEAIQELAWVASYFHDQVRYEPSLYRTASDFELLTEAFSRAAWWMNRVPTNRRVQKEFRKLEVSFNQLGRHYGVRPPGFERAGRYRMDDGRYHEILRARVIPRVHGKEAYRRGEPRVRLDVGLRISGGRVRVVWR
jgi:hypothetical protein